MKRSLLKVTLILLSMVILLGLTGYDSIGAQASTAEPTPIKMACLAPFSGNYAQYGEGYKAAIELKLTEYNENGGYNGRQVVCEYYDDKMDAKEAVTVAQKIANEDYICCVGPWSSTILFAVAPTFEKAKMPLYGISPSHSDVSKQGEFIIRHSPDIIQFTDAEARLAYNEFGLRTAALLYYVDDMATTASERFTGDFESLGGKVVASETYMTGAVDFSAQLTKMIAADPDYIWIQGSYNDTARIIQQARELDYKGRISIPAASYNPALLELAGPYLEGSTSIVHVDPDLPEAVALGEKFTAASNRTLDAHSYMAYDTAWHVIQALDAVGPDKVAIAGFLRNSTVDGTFGKVVYTNGAPVSPVFPVIVKDGAYTSYEPENISREDLAVLFK